MAKRIKRTPPPVGSEYAKNYKGENYNLKVVDTDKGVGYLLDGFVFKSPTAAAKAVVGQHQFINGWKFWKMDDAKDGGNDEN